MTDSTEILFKATKLALTTYLVAHWQACLFWEVGKTQALVSPESWINIDNLKDA